MALTAVFDVEGMSAEDYDGVIAELDRRGLQHPAGRLLHTASERPGGWMVVDVWSSEAEFGAFGGVLGPILGSRGLHVEPRLLRNHACVADPALTGAA